MNRFALHRLAGTLAGLLLALSSLQAEPIEARWGLEADEAIVGQSLTLTLQIQGSDQFKPPTLEIKGVEAQWLGSRPENSTSMVSVNGRTTTTVRTSLVAGWSLKASQPGRYRIPAMDWSAGGQAIHLPALEWTVKAAESDARFFLKQELSGSDAVPGLELEYRLTWYLGQSAQNPEFSLPILDHPDLELVEASLAPPSGDVFQTQYRGHTLTGLKSSEDLGGNRYTTLTFRFRVRAAKPGAYDLSGTRVTFSGAVATRQVRDFFGNVVEEPAYKTIAALANPLVLQVSALPAAGKPAVFSGLIGKLSLSWTGLQGPYRVGEPIRLGLKLDGVLNKPRLDLDAMVTQALADPDFQISPDPARQGEAGGERGFVVRARRSGRLVIPALSLNYYDPAAKRYGVTETKALAIDILDSPAGIAAGTGAAAAPTTIPGPADQAAADGAPLNPSGLPGARLSWLPWWAWAVPPSLAGLALLGLGAWRHSARRRLRLARLAWQAGLRPLEPRDPRAQLEEARGRLLDLLSVGSPWRDRLQASGQLRRLQDLAGDWDLAFFAQGREHEPWAERWAALCDEARGWK